MRRLFPLALVLLARVSLGVVFPDTAVDAPVYYAPTAPPLRLGAAVAAGASSYLTAWEERASLAKPASIYVRALQPGGAPRQPMAVLVARGETPAIAWNGIDYFVAWKNGSAIEAVRVTEDGVVLGQTHVVVTTAAGGRPAVAWNGTQYAVAWGDGAAVLDRYGSVVRALPAASAVVALGGDFVLANGNRIQNSSGSADVGHPVLALTTSGTTVSAYWSSGTSISISVFDAALEPIRTYSTSVLASGALAAVELGEEVLAVAASSRSGPDADVSYGRVGPTTGAFWYDHAGGRTLEPALASNGTTTLLVFSERNSGVDAIRVAVAEHTWLSPSINNATTISTTGTAGRAPALALGDDRAVVAWFARDPASDKMNIAAGGATFAGAALPRHAVDVAAHPVDLTITRNGDRYLLLWADVDPYWREGPIRAAIVDRGGAVVVAPMTIGNGDRPTAASDGVRWLVAWETHSRISGLDVTVAVATMSAEGGMGPASELVADFFRLEPYVAWDGRDFVVLWAESLGLRQRERIVAMRFDVNGNPTSSAAVLEESFTEPLRTAGIAASGGRDFALWTRGAQLVASVDLGAPFPIATTSVAGARIAPAPNGHAAVIYEKGPLMLTYIAATGPAGTLDLPSTAVAWDFAMRDSSVILAYERPTGALEELGTSAVFVRGLEFRRHASR